MMRCRLVLGVFFVCLVHAIPGRSETPEGPNQLQGPTFNNTGNNACSLATIVPIAVGPPGAPITTTIFGNNSTATLPDCRVFPDIQRPIWWEAFQLTEPAFVTIDLCGTTPVQEPSYDVLFGQCTPAIQSCSAVARRSASGRGAPVCGDNNIWHTYVELNPGTYRLPIYSDATVLAGGLGPYIVHIHASQCPGSCCDMIARTCTDCVDPATCTDPGEVFNAGETCFEARCFSPEGPDTIVGNVFSCEHLGRVGPIGSGTVAMSCWTTACNQGNAKGNWIALPSVDHPVILVNMYKMATVNGASRFEQIGYSWLKHGFGSANADECNFGCVPGAAFEEIGIGCSDTYAACQFQACGLGARSMINPYTGAMPEGPSLGTIANCGPCENDDQNYPSNDHRDHVHDSISHRVQIRETDLDPFLNPGARYFAEGQYIAPHEFNAGNGNQNNNVSHVEVSISGPDINGFYFYSEVGATVTESPAVDAWSGASQTLIEPAPLVDGRSILAWQVTDLGGGQWHYEYVLYNQNMDRAIGSLCIPLAAGANIANVSFHAPVHHAPEPNADNYSDAPWTPTITSEAIRWDTESITDNPLANAVRFATLYNFRFDADVPPQNTVSAVGMFKIDQTVAAATQGPSPATHSDINNNGIPDVCEDVVVGPLQPDPSGIDNNRYLSFIVPPPATAGAATTAIEVSLVELMNPMPPNLPQFPPPDFSAFEGQRHYVAAPSDCVESDFPPATFKCAELQCVPLYLDWQAATAGQVLHVAASSVVPSSTYSLRQLPLTCQGTEQTCSAASPPLVVRTARWGDVASPFQDPAGPLLQPNISDVAAVVDKFKGIPGAIIVARGDIQPDRPNNVINIADVSSTVDAFKNFAYPFEIQVSCP